MKHKTFWKIYIDTISEIYATDYKHKQNILKRLYKPIRKTDITNIDRILERLEDNDITDTRAFVVENAIHMRKYSKHQLTLSRLNTQKAITIYLDRIQNLVRTNTMIKKGKTKDIYIKKVIKIKFSSFSIDEKKQIYKIIRGHR